MEVFSMRQQSYAREVCDILSACLVLLSGIAVAPLAGIATVRAAEMSAVSPGALFLSMVVMALAAFVAGAPAVKPWLASQPR